MLAKRFSILFLLATQSLATSQGQRDVLESVYRAVGPALPDQVNDNKIGFALWPSGKVPSERPGHIGTETHTAGDCGSTDLIYNNVTVPTLTPFLVRGAKSAVVIAPGGGYSILAFNREGTDIAQWANSIGISAFVLKYRVPQRSWLSFGAAPLMDAQRALGLVRSQASKFGIDHDKIGFMGFSAGGHLTAHVSTNYNSRTYPPVDAADEVSCKPDFSLLVYPWSLVDDKDLTRLLMNVTNNTPPAFLSQAEDDEVHVENAIAYFLGMKRTKAAPSELHAWPAGGHGYGRCKVCPTHYVPACGWPDLAAAFLRRIGMAPNTTTDGLVV